MTIDDNVALIEQDKALERLKQEEDKKVKGSKICKTD
jgi:hypothetical protein